MSYEKVLAERVRLLRTRAGMEQKELADKLGIAQTALSNYEKGTRKIPVALIPEIAAIFSCTTDFLFGLVDDTVDTKGYVVHLRED